MKIDIITIFPKMFGPVLGESIIKRAQKKDLIEINIHNLRDYSKDKHRKVDDRPYGGGPGMVMMAEPIFDAVRKIAGGLQSRSRRKRAKSGAKDIEPRIILLTPQGRTLNQKICKKLSRYRHLILICAHYEGIDERVRKYLADDEISIGDYILTGGELPAMVLLDCVVRLLPGVLGEDTSKAVETFEDNLIEYPQYTRPARFKNYKVPEILLSGDHKKINQWRRREALKATSRKRPDLLKN